MGVLPQYMTFNSREVKATNHHGQLLCLFTVIQLTNSLMMRTHIQNEKKSTIKQSSGHRLMLIWIEKKKSKFKWCRKDRIQEGSWSLTETESCCVSPAGGSRHPFIYDQIAAGFTSTLGESQRPCGCCGWTDPAGRGGGGVWCGVVWCRRWLFSVTLCGLNRWGGVGARGYSPLLYSRAGRGTSWEVGIRIEMQ